MKDRRRKDMRQTESLWIKDDYIDVPENDKLLCKCLFP
jgi:hypothetical protein